MLERERERGLKFEIKLVTVIVELRDNKRTRTEV